MNDIIGPVYDLFITTTCILKIIYQKKIVFYRPIFKIFLHKTIKIRQKSLHDI